MDALDRYRDEFPILSRTVYMISNSLGAMPRQTARHLAEYAETWATRGVRAWEERWWEMPVEVGNKIAPHHRRAGRHGQHARERDDGAHGRAVVAAAVGRAEPHRLLGDGFPVDAATCIARRRRAGFELRVVPAEDDLSVDTERMLDAIDDTHRAWSRSRTCCSGRSYIMDAAAIAAPRTRSGRR